MTIFNWVQKKLHQNVIKDGERKKRSEGVSEIEKNTKAILDQVGLVEALDNWFDGVLTIGTFGFDTLKFQEEDQLRDDDDDDDDDDECESVDLDYVVIDGSIIKKVDRELDPLISNQTKSYDDHDHHHDFEILDIVHIDSIKTMERAVVSAAIKAKPEPQKKRTTLAELFMKDQDNDTWHGKKPKNPNLDEEVKNCKYNGLRLSSKLSSAKQKMIKSKSKDEEEEDLRPIKKLHQMMKRMLKKKIHPDIDAAKALKKDVAFKQTQKREALETIYLLN